MLKELEQLKTSRHRPDKKVSTEHNNINQNINGLLSKDTRLTKSVPWQGNCAIQIRDKPCNVASVHRREDLKFVNYADDPSASVRKNHHVFQKKNPPTFQQ